jgi:hypothetical protein
MPSPLLVRISPAQSEQWYRWIGRRRIISALAEHRGNAWQRKHPAENPGTRPELRIPVVTANSLGGPNSACCVKFART